MKTIRMKVLLILGAILALAAASVAVAAPEDGLSGAGDALSTNNDNGLRLSFSARTDYGFYASTNKDFSNLGNVGTLFIAGGVSKEFKEKHEASLLLGYQATGLYSYYGTENRDDVSDIPGGAVGYLNGIGLEGYYTYRPYKYLGVGALTSFYAATGADCTEEVYDTCKNAKANRIDAGVTLATYINDNIRPYFSVSYSQMNFRRRPYETVILGIGISGNIAKTRYLSQVGQ